MFDDLHTTSNNFSRTLAHRLRDLRKSRSADEIIAALWELLSNTEDEFPYLEVMGQLDVEYVRAGKQDEVAELYALALSRFPNSLNGHIAYAERLVWSDGDPNLALEVSTRAVELAKQYNALIRHALQGKARAAKNLGMFAVVEDVLQEILEADQVGALGDIQYEIDVVNGIPEGTVDNRLIEEFRSRCKPRISN